jgi:hypothetical protein
MRRSSVRKRTQIGRISGSLFVVITVIVGLGLGAGCVVLTACQGGGPESLVIVEWTTESEVETAGFNLYRSESPAGPYVKVNPALIPGASDPLLGGQYVYTDTNVVAGRTYYYKLEDVELDGTTSLHGPIEVVAEVASPSVFADLGDLWPLAMLIAVFVLGGVILSRWRGRRE